MKGHGESVRFVANLLDEPQRRIVFFERNRFLAIARIQKLFLLRDADRNQVGETKLLQRVVGGRQLPLAAVDQNEVWKRPALFEELAIPPRDDLVHRREIVRSRVVRG